MKRRIDPTSFIMAISLAVVVLAVPDVAHANPFASAIEKACAAQRGLRQLAGVMGLLGMTVALMMGYFNKLDWKWVATCIGCCFALGCIPGIMQMAGGSSGC